jgi:hypothetical protein
MLSSLCHELGVEPVDLGIAKDDIDDIVEKLKEGLERTQKEGLSRILPYYAPPLLLNVYLF